MANHDKLDEVDPILAVGALGSVAVGGAIGAGVVRAIRNIRGLLRLGKKTAAEDAWSKISQDDRRTIELLIQGERRKLRESTAHKVVDGAYRPKGSLGIERKDMPQITGANTEAFLTWLGEQGVSYKRVSVPVSRLKPTQTHIAVSGVERVRQAPSKLHAVLASKDNYILDGHHRWMQLNLDAPDTRMPLIQVNLSARKLIELARKFPGTVYREDIEEGVYDPHILRAVFTAGSAGSGKSFISAKMFGGMGLKIVNSDVALERAMAKAGLDLKRDMASDQVQRPGGIRDQAKATATKQLDSYVRGRLGLLIDSTATKIDKVSRLVTELRALGYDVFMVFVNTSLEVALQRNRDRARTVPENIARADWAQVQKNVEMLRQAFGPANFREVVNDDVLSPADVKSKLIPKMTRVALSLLNRPLRNPVGKAWIANELAAKAGRKQLAASYEEPMTNPLAESRGAYAVWTRVAKGKGYLLSGVYADAQVAKGHRDFDPNSQAVVTRVQGVQGVKSIGEWAKLADATVASIYRKLGCGTDGRCADLAGVVESTKDTVSLGETYSLVPHKELSAGITYTIDMGPGPAMGKMRPKAVKDGDWLLRNWEQVSRFAVERYEGTDPNIDVVLTAHTHKGPIVVMPFASKAVLQGFLSSSVFHGLPILWLGTHQVVGEGDEWDTDLSYTLDEFTSAGVPSMGSRGHVQREEDDIDDEEEFEEDTLEESKFKLPPDLVLLRMNVSHRTRDKIMRDVGDDGVPVRTWGGKRDILDAVEGLVVKKSRAEELRKKFGKALTIPRGIEEIATWYGDNSHNVKAWLDKHGVRLGGDATNEDVFSCLGFRLGDDGKLRALKVETKTHECPECGEGNAYWHEAHADTGMDEWVLRCPDCRAETTREDTEESVEEAATPPDATVHKGVYYFHLRKDAQKWAEANGWPTDRIISYTRGYAVQAGKSGNYAGPGSKPKQWGESVDEAEPTPPASLVPDGYAFVAAVVVNGHKVAILREKGKGLKGTYTLMIDGKMRPEKLASHAAALKKAKQLVEATEPPFVSKVTGASYPDAATRDRMEKLAQLSKERKRIKAELRRRKGKPANEDSFWDFTNDDDEHEHVQDRQRQHAHALSADVDECIELMEAGVTGWRTTKRGQRIYLENGKVTKGNPHLLKHVSKRGGAKGEAPDRKDKKPERDDKPVPRGEEKPAPAAAPAKAKAKGGRLKRFVRGAVDRILGVESEEFDDEPIEELATALLPLRGELSRLVRDNSGPIPASLVRKYVDEDPYVRNPARDKEIEKVMRKLGYRLRGKMYMPEAVDEGIRQEVLLRYAESGIESDLRKLLVQNPDQSFTLKQLALAVNAPEMAVRKSINQLVIQGTASFARGAGYRLAGKSINLTAQDKLAARKLRVTDRRTTSLDHVDFGKARRARIRGESEEFDEEETDETTRSTNVSGKRRILGAEHFASGDGGGRGPINYEYGLEDEPENKGREGGIRDDGPGKQGKKTKWAVRESDEELDEARTIDGDLRINYGQGQVWGHWSSRQRREADRELARAKSEGGRPFLEKWDSDVGEWVNARTGEMSGGMSAAQRRRWSAGPDEGRESFKDFDDPWKAMSPEDRKEANRLTIAALRALAGSPRQKEFQVKRDALLAKYGIGKAKDEASIDELDDSRASIQINMEWDGEFERYNVQLPQNLGPPGSYPKDEYHFDTYDEAMEFVREMQAEHNFFTVVWNLAPADQLRFSEPGPKRVGEARASTNDQTIEVAWDGARKLYVIHDEVHTESTYGTFDQAMAAATQLAARGSYMLVVQSLKPGDEPAHATMESCDEAAKPVGKVETEELELVQFTESDLEKLVLAGHSAGVDREAPVHYEDGVFEIALPASQAAQVKELMAV